MIDLGDAATDDDDHDDDDDDDHDDEEDDACGQDINDRVKDPIWMDVVATVNDTNDDNNLYGSCERDVGDDDDDNISASGSLYSCDSFCSIPDGQDPIRVVTRGTLWSQLTFWTRSIVVSVSGIFRILSNSKRTAKYHQIQDELSRNRTPLNDFRTKTMDGVLSVGDLVRRLDDAKDDLHHPRTDDLIDNNDDDAYYLNERSIYGKLDRDTIKAYYTICPAILEDAIS